MVEINAHKLHWHYTNKDHSSTFPLQRSSWRTYHSSNNWVHRFSSSGKVDLSQCEIGHSCRLPPRHKHQPNTSQCHFGLPRLKRWTWDMRYAVTWLQWRHNEYHCVSNHRRLDCLRNRLSRRRSKNTLKLRVTGLCERNSLVTGVFSA